MNADRLLAHYERVADAPDAIPRLRRFILELAVGGKLAPQDANDEPDPKLLARAAGGQSRLDQSGLPVGWARTTLGSALEFQYGKGLNANERMNEGAVPVFGSNGVVGYCEKALTATPSIIVGRKGSAGALNLCDGPSWTTDVAYYVEKPPFFHLRFLLMTLQTLDLGRLGKGVKPGLSRSDVYPLSVNVPPVAEQVRIVAKADEWMKLCDRLEVARNERESVRDRLTAASFARLDAPDTDSALFACHARFALDNLSALTVRIDQIKQLRETILNLAVRGKLVPQKSEDEPASEILARIAVEKARLMARGIIPRSMRFTQDLDELSSANPLQWKSAYLGELCHLVTSGSRGWAEFYTNTGPKFISAQNIRFGQLRLDDLACVTPPKTSEGARAQAAKDDLLIVITGAGVTNPALLNCDLGEAYVSQHVALIKPTERALAPWILMWLMAPEGGRSVLVERAYGAGKPGLNLKNIRSLVIRLPPLAEQRRIVAKVYGLMSLCDRLEESLVSGEDHRRRLLGALFAEALAPAEMAVA